MLAPLRYHGKGIKNCFNHLTLGKPHLYTNNKNEEMWNKCQPDLHQCKCNIQNTFNDSKFSKFIHVLNIECSLKDNVLPFKE